MPLLELVQQPPQAIPDFSSSIRCSGRDLDQTYVEGLGKGIAIHSGNPKGDVWVRLAREHDGGDFFGGQTL